jgi:hypothetical protein
MELKISKPCSQESVTELYREPSQTNLQSQIQML